MLKFQLNIFFSEILSCHYQFNSQIVACNITGETSFCVSGKTSNMLDCWIMVSQEKTVLTT